MVVLKLFKRSYSSIYSLKESTGRIFRGRLRSVGGFGLVRRGKEIKPYAIMMVRL
jgi:hypothetical protein